MGGVKFGGRAGLLELAGVWGPIAAAVSSFAATLLLPVAVPFRLPAASSSAEGDRPPSAVAKLTEV